MKLGHMKIAVGIGEILHPQGSGGFPILQLDILGPALVPEFHLAVDIDVKLDLLVVLQVDLAFIMLDSADVLAHLGHVDLGSAVVNPIPRAGAVLGGFGDGFALLVVSCLAIMVQEDNRLLGEPVLDGRVPSVGGLVVVDRVGADGATQCVEKDGADLGFFDEFRDCGISGCHAEAGVQNVERFNHGEIELGEELRGCFIAPTLVEFKLVHVHRYKKAVGFGGGQVQVRFPGLDGIPEAIQQPRLANATESMYHRDRVVGGQWVPKTWGWFNVGAK